ncbi:MAG: rod shape-determining protein MreC [Lachnospiraceae bacterium]|nr:rod shape-determining protein MreC [Lachnospiraceae bacterium]
MSPRFEKNREERKAVFSAQLLMVITGVLCVILMIVTFNVPSFIEPFADAADLVIVPFQEGLGRVGKALVRVTDYFGDIEELREENRQLKNEIASLIEDKTQLQEKNYSLRRLEDLYETQREYSQYEKLSASVIAKDSGNWYHSFIINKGEADGIRKDMNVMAAGGLVGRISQTGRRWARVEAIIDDNSNVSSMILGSGENLIVSGSLKLYDTGSIAFSQLFDAAGNVKNGDKVITSNISDKYLPGILIGYINMIEKDPNNITSSGYITPAVDFEHLDTVLVILEIKQQAEYEETDE